MAESRADTGEAEKAYYVERRARTLTTVLVFAATAEEAREKAQDGEFTELDSRTTGGGPWKAYRAPLEDDRA